MRPFRLCRDDPSLICLRQLSFSRGVVNVNTSSWRLVVKASNAVTRCVFTRLIKVRDCCAWSLLASSSKYSSKTRTTQRMMMTSTALFSCCSWHPIRTTPRQTGPGSSWLEPVDATKRGELIITNRSHTTVPKLACRVWRSKTRKLNTITVMASGPGLRRHLRICKKINFRLTHAYSRNHQNLSKIGQLLTETTFDIAEIHQ